MMRVEFLGTGTSHGVPVIGCKCPVCRSKDPHDNRMRSSILIEKDGTKVVIDTGYEFRIQAIRAGLDTLDAVIYTHSHADHIAGMDDLRVFTRSGKRLDVYGSSDTLDVLKTAFPYAFGRTVSGIPSLVANEIPYGGTFRVGSIEFRMIPIMHGSLRISGYIFSSFAYLTDVSDILFEENEEYFKNVKTLIIGALRESPHPKHFSFKEAVNAGKRIGAKKIYFTHINHELSDMEIRERYADEASPAYDTLVLEE